MLAVNGVAKMRPKKPVKAVTTGSDGLRYAIDADGKLWTRGGNSDGQLGHESNFRFHDPD